VGFRTSEHPRNERPFRVSQSQFLRLLIRQGLYFQRPDRTAPYLTEAHQIVDDSSRQVARHRKTDSLVPAAFTEDPGVDANQLAARVDERTARVAAVDSGVGLDEIFIVGKTQSGPARRADDASRDRPVELIRAADRKDPFTDL